MFVCENNGYGEYTPTDAVTAGSIVARAEAMEIPSGRRRRDGRLGGAGGGARTRPSRVRRGERPRVRRGAHVPLRRPLAQRSRASTGRRVSSSEWRERDPLLVAEQRLTADHGASRRSPARGGRRCRARAPRGGGGGARRRRSPTGRVQRVQGMSGRPSTRRAGPARATDDASATSLRVGARAARPEPARARAPPRGLAEPRLPDRDGQDRSRPSGRSTRSSPSSASRSTSCSRPRATTTRPRPPRGAGDAGRHRDTLPPVGFGRVQRADERDVIDLGSGVRWERLTTWNDRDVEFLYAVYEGGGSSSPDGSLMRHNGREFGIVLTGQLGVTVGFEDTVLGPGDSIAFDSDDPAPAAQRRRRGRHRDLDRSRPPPRSRPVGASWACSYGSFSISRHGRPVDGGDADRDPDAAPVRLDGGGDRHQVAQAARRAGRQGRAAGRDRDRQGDDRLRGRVRRVSSTRSSSTRARPRRSAQTIARAHGTGGSAERAAARAARRAGRDGVAVHPLRRRRP